MLRASLETLQSQQEAAKAILLSGSSEDLRGRLQAAQAFTRAEDAHRKILQSYEQAKAELAQKELLLAQ